MFFLSLGWEKWEEDDQILFKFPLFKTDLKLKTASLIHFLLYFGKNWDIE